METVLGPVELVVLAFPGSQFNGKIIPAMAELVDSGVVSIVDLAIVTRTESGEVLALELAELDPDVRTVFDDLDGVVSGLLSEEDLVLAAESLEPGNTAAVLVWENTWARKLVAEIRDSGGFLVAHERLDAATVAAAMDSIDPELLAPAGQES